MKVTPLAQGTGVPAASDSSLGKTASPSKIERAKAIAMGQEVPVAATQPSSGDAQVDRAQASIKRIKMKTQVSTNRDDTTGQFVAAEEPEVEQSATADVVEQTKETEETRPLSPQFAALAKAKRALQIERADFEKMKASEAQTSSFNKEDYVSKAELKSNPLSVLQGNGVTYDQLTEAILNNQNAPLDPQKLREQIKEDLKKELLGEFGTRDQQAEQQVLSEIKREAVQVANAQPEKFEALRQAKAFDDVKDLVHRVWQKGWPEKGLDPGYVMSTEEAAELVENQLIEDALPFARIKKVQSRLTPAQAAQQTVQIPVVQQQKPNTKIMRTLTNRDNASPIMDKRARAIAAMNGTLKKG